MIEAAALSHPAPAPVQGNMQALEASAREFEAMFLSEMMNHMFEGVEADPLFGGGKGENMFRGLMTNEYAKDISRGPGIGLSKHILDAMISMQQEK